MNYLIVILGPTASGKSDLAVQLATRFQTEVLSADSRQFYREMDIGTAKPVFDENVPNKVQGVPHHFINSLSIHDEYSAGDFEREAISTLNTLWETKKAAILAGGSGLYINAVLFGIDPFPSIDSSVRKKVIELYHLQGIEGLRNELRTLDAKYYVEVDLENPRRLMRALEVCYSTGSSYSSYRSQQPKKRSFTPIKIACQWDRDRLYERINRRVDQMIDQGLVQEAQQLYSNRQLPALDTIGYKELFDVFDGKIELEKAVQLIKRNSRRYAKRQLTWFKADPEIHWIKPNTDIETIYQFVLSEMSKQEN